MHMIKLNVKPIFNHVNKNDLPSLNGVNGILFSFVLVEWEVESKLLPDVIFSSGNVLAT